MMLKLVPGGRLCFVSRTSCLRWAAMASWSCRIMALGRPIIWAHAQGKALGEGRNVMVVVVVVVVVVVRVSQVSWREACPYPYMQGGGLCHAIQ